MAEPKAKPAAKTLRGVIISTETRQTKDGRDYVVVTVTTTASDGTEKTGVMNAWKPELLQGIAPGTEADITYNPPEAQGRKATITGISPLVPAAPAPEEDLPDDFAPDEEFLVEPEEPAQPAQPTAKPAPKTAPETAVEDVDDDFIEAIAAEAAEEETKPAEPAKATAPAAKPAPAKAETAEDADGIPDDFTPEEIPEDFKVVEDAVPTGSQYAPDPDEGNDADEPNLIIYNKLRKPPKEATKPFKGAGGFQGTDINPMWRLKTMTKVFGPYGVGWRLEPDQTGEILKFWKFDAAAATGEVKVFCSLKLQIREAVMDRLLQGLDANLTDNEFRKAVLASPWLPAIQGTGGNSLIEIRKGQKYVNDEAYKMAYTDALSQAMKPLGFAADIYWESGATKYNPTAE